MILFRLCLIAALAAGVSFFSGCAVPSEGDGASSEAPSDREPEWTFSQRSSSDGSAELESYQIQETDENAAKDRLRRKTRLSPLHIPSSFNASAFLLESEDAAAVRPVVAPRLFAYRPEDGARLAHFKNLDGSVTLLFPLALTDGLSDLIQGPRGGPFVRVPHDVRIKNRDELGSYVRSVAGRALPLGALQGCLKKLVVRVGGTEIDATPSQFSNCEASPLNTPFLASVTVNEGIARQIREQALYQSALEARAQIEIQVPFTSAQNRLAFQNLRLIENLERAMARSSGFWVQRNLRTQVMEVLRKMTEGLELDSAGEEALSEIADQIARDYFVRVRSDVAAQHAECSGSTCFELDSNRFSQAPAIVRTWVTQTPGLTGITYQTWTLLQPLEERAVVIGSEEEDGRPILSNRGNSLETGLTVLPDDTLEIEPYALEIERIGPSIAEVDARQGRTVCLQEVPKVVRECVLENDDHERRGARRRMVCRDVVRGTQCAAEEFQWSETTRYRRGASRIERIERPIGQVPMVYSGLTLKFKWNGGEETCALNTFVQEGAGLTMRVRLNDNPSCRVFERAGRESLSLHLINQIAEPITYRSGTTQTNWKGESTDRTVMAPYAPQISFSGRISIRGYSIGSTRSNGEMDRR